MSCATNLLSMLETWMLMTDEGSLVNAINLDFAKVVDSVSHEWLLKMADAL